MTLNDIGLRLGTDKASDHHGYLDFYQKNLPKNPKRLLEVGVQGGESIAMWREYYPKAEIVGIDITEPLDIEGATCLKINSNDVYELKKLGKFDLIIDDGSHRMLDQQVFMQFALDNMLSDNGVFVMEDLHTSKWGAEWFDGAAHTTADVIKSMEDEYDITYFDRTGTKDVSYTAIIRRK